METSPSEVTGQEQGDIEAQEEGSVFLSPTRRGVAPRSGTQPSDVQGFKEAFMYCLEISIFLFKNGNKNINSTFNVYHGWTETLHRFPNLQYCYVLLSACEEKYFNL